MIIPARVDLVASNISNDLYDQIVKVKKLNEHDASSLNSFSPACLKKFASYRKIIQCLLVNGVV
jgi:hypothetical protein